MPDVWNALPRHEDFAVAYKARLAAKRKDDEARQKEAQRKQGTP